MRFLPDRDNLCAAVVGLGYVGSAVAGTLADRGVDVVGVDTDASRVDELNRRFCRINEPGLPELLARGVDTGRLRATTDYAAVSGADVVVVAVGTPVGEGGVLVDVQLEGACAALADHIRPGQLLVFKSTVPPGTTRDLVAPALEQGGLVCGRDFGLAFCPERLSEGTALRELLSSPVVVGGWNADSVEAAATFWSRSLGTEIIRCSSLESAEMVKLADNWWIDHNIALANELAMLCGELGVDVLDVIAAANSIPKGNGNVNILLPSVGVGGSCLTKDPWMVWRAARNRGLDLGTIPVVRGVNDAMPAYTAALVTDELGKLGKQVAGSKVAVIGLAFKNNTGDLRATPTLPVVETLRDGGAEVTVFDPLVDADEAEKVFGVRPAGSAAEAARDADCLAVLAWHDEFGSLDLTELPVAPSCAVVDGRAYFPAATIERLRGHGFAYRGIGW